MQCILHSSAQRTASGESSATIEPGIQARALIVNVTQISVNLLGSITFRVQHSVDGESWSDIPNLATSGLSATGIVTIAVSPTFSALDYLRVAWTFNNANSVTFIATLTGDK